MQRIVAILLSIVFLLPLSGLGLANEESEAEHYESVSKKLIEIKEKSLASGSLSDNLKKEAEGFDAEEQLQSIVDKADMVGNTVWLIAQAQTWPAFIYGISGGIILLLVGLVISLNFFKRIGGFLLFFAFAQLILINYAPELAEGLINMIGSLF